MPDIEVHEANVELVDDTPSRREADLRGRLRNEGETGKAPNAERGKPNTLDAKDYQLARAIDLLRGIALYEGRNTAQR